MHYNAHHLTYELAGSSPREYLGSVQHTGSTFYSTCCISRANVTRYDVWTYVHTEQLRK